MSTLIVAVIIIGFVAAICLLLISIHNKHKREAMNNLLKHFSQLATENNLIFSKQEVLNTCVVALDGTNRKILVVTKEDSFYGSFIIDLDEVNICTVKKVYGTIKAGDLKDDKLDQHLEKIVLQFTLDNKPSIEIEFYHHYHNHMYEMPELVQKAKQWGAMLSKMLKPLKQIA